MQLPVTRWSKKALLVIGIILAGYITFTAGYQLAVYQASNGGNFWLPHFPVNQPETPGCAGLAGCGYQCPYTGPCLRPLKPVIYLYPQHQETVNVRLAYPPGLQSTVPAYNPASGWTVIASPGGDLRNPADNRTYPYLFWEGKPYAFTFDMAKGFVVPGAGAAQFLANELAMIGLNHQEAAVFISYWAPKLLQNPYNLIHFAGREYTLVAQLTITPKPDSLLRVFMVYRPLQQPVPVTPQVFSPFSRVGFSAVEWGGAEATQ